MDQTNPNVSASLVPKKYKVVLLGDQAVGKTSIIKRYSEKGFKADAEVFKCLNKAYCGSRFCT